MQYFWRSICSALALALLCGPLLPAAAQSALARQSDTAVFLVNSTADAPDSDLNDGRCAAPGGACTLRAAIMQASAAGASQTIELPQGVYTLTIANDDPANDQGVRDLDIFGALTIRGVGPGQAIVQAGPAQGSGIDRVFEIHRGADARIENVGVRYGRAEEAGGIRVWGTLALVDSFVTASDLAASGGGCTFEAESGDLISQPPLLGTLQGESPQTHGLNPGSPAIDAGDPAGCVDDAGQPLRLDQRKAPRPSGPRCDIGAFEASTLAPAPGADQRCFSETGFCIAGASASSGSRTAA
jgi:CSLREA domain-containing protein